MSSSLLTASPSTQSAPSGSKQPPFDDTCFKTPLPFKKPRGRGRGATSANTGGGGVRPNGYHSTGSGRGRGVGRPPARVVAPAPPPPPPKFVLHDVVCPHTAAYLGALSLPKYASVQPGNDVKEEADNKENITNKLPFVEETILDEFSLLLFTCLPDAQVFEKELDALRAREEIEKKRLAAEKAVRIEKLKRKIRSKKFLQSDRTPDERVTRAMFIDGDFLSPPLRRQCVCFPKAISLTL
ncbi:unnamed protein product [Heligmosomoides polygyrus]|uniref:Uncharacterized protein n=1 Tax=Heligmosomoides polygyrus TaxID=6339 RepID=A0A3P7X2N5_HELPZ|nr:unnamed protein product [Heligmosomoides polygyrus]